MNWHENIPDNCPPGDAEVPNGRTFYRLCGNPPNSSDFWSELQNNPKRKFANVPICTLRSVSIWSNRNRCVKQKKFPRHKDKSLGELILRDEDGLVKKTFGKNHYSWWRSNRFDPNLVIILD